MNARVERRHRLAALESLSALYKADDAEGQRWLDHGDDDPKANPLEIDACGCGGVCPEPIAQAIADAEAAERTAVIAECERTERTVSSEGECVVQALRVRIQRGEHRGP